MKLVTSPVISASNFFRNFSILPFVSSAAPSPIKNGLFVCSWRRRTVPFKQSLQTGWYFLIGQRWAYCYYKYTIRYIYIYIYNRHGVNSILSIPIPLNSIWSIPIPSQIYQFQFNSKMFNSNSGFIPTSFCLIIFTISRYSE